MVTKWKKKIYSKRLLDKQGRKPSAKNKDVHFYSSDVVFTSKYEKQLSTESYLICDSKNFNIGNINIPALHSREACIKLPKK